MVYGVFYCQQFRLVGNMDISIHSCLKRSMSKKLLKCFWMNTSLYRSCCISVAEYMHAEPLNAGLVT